MKKSFEIVEEIKRNSEKVKELDAVVKSAKWSERNAEKIAESAKAAELLRIENKILKTTPAAPCLRK